MIKGIALDIDGTITYKNRQLDLPAVKSIRKAENEGIPIILATGNILCFTKAASTLIGTSGPLIAEDGGIVYDNKKDKEYVIGELEEVKKGTKILENKLPDLKHTWTSKDRKAGRVLEKTVEQEEVSKILEEENLNLVAVDSGFAIHIKTPEVNKGEALKKVSEILDCKVSQIAVMGDGKNDLEMLQKSKHSYAPSNAAKEVKEIANHITEKPHGEGVQEMISKIIEK